MGLFDWLFGTKQTKDSEKEITTPDRYHDLNPTEPAPDDISVKDAATYSVNNECISSLHGHDPDNTYCCREITLDYVRDLVVELFGVNDSQIDKHELVVKYMAAKEKNTPLDGRAFLAECLVTAKIVDTLGVGLDEIKPSAKLIEDLGADSLDAVEIVLVLEEMTKSEISDEEADQLVTVSDLINFVKSKL